MEIRQHLAIVRKRLWMIVIVTAAAACISALVSFFLFKPVYESVTELFVVNANIDDGKRIAYDDLLASQQLVKDYKEIIKSRAVLRKTMQELGLADADVGKLADKIIVNLKNDTRILQIKVHDGDPERAKVIADKLSAIFIKKASELMVMHNVNLIDSAEVPTQPVKPRHSFIIIVSSVIGMLIALGTAYLIEYIDDTVKTSEDVEKYMKLKVLGTIPVLDLE